MTLSETNHKAAADVARRNKAPFVYFDEAEVDRETFPFPYLGSKVPAGWTLTGEWDLGDCVQEGFISFEQMRNRSKALLSGQFTYGFGITYSNAFQVRIGVFKKD